MINEGITHILIYCLINEIREETKSMYLHLISWNFLSVFQVACTVDTFLRTTLFCCHRLADLMEEHQEELATLESLDSGAVYTLALKTHIGMSIQTIRYFAGWCDKIHGQTIPINHAKPNHNLTFTKKEPIG